MNGRIPQEFLDNLLHNTDIVELIDSYVPLKKAGNTYTACCPFHHEKSPSFNVSARRQFYHCYGCSANGNAISFVMQHLHLEFPEAVELLAVRIGLPMPKRDRGSNQRHDLYHLMSKIATFYQECLRASTDKAIPYLKGRGLTGQTAKIYGIGFAPPAWHTLEKKFPQQKKELLDCGMLVEHDNKIYDRYRDRIMFPIHDKNGRITGFGGRVLDNSQKPKYLNSPETALFHKGRELYGLWQVLQTCKNPKTIIIVEGYLDVIALREHGITFAVAALGTAISAQHIKILAKHTRQIVFCLDGDKAGKTAAERALENALPHLDDTFTLSFAFLPEQDDPDSFIQREGRDKFLAYIENALPLHEVLLHKLTEGLDFNNIATKSQCINNARELVGKIGNNTWKQLLIEEIAKRVHLDPHKVANLIEKREEYFSPIATPLNVSRTPVEIAMALIIQNPAIYTRSNITIDAALLDTPEQALLKHLVTALDNNPDISAASFVELWRNTEFFATINKLAAWEHQVPEEAAAREFFDIVMFLIKQNNENNIGKYMKKARESGLSQQERVLLQELLRMKHKHGNTIDTIPGS